MRNTESFLMTIPSIHINAVLSMVINNKDYFIITIIYIS